MPIRSQSGRRATFHYTNALSIAAFALNELGNAAAVPRMVTDLTQLNPTTPCL